MLGRRLVLPLLLPVALLAGCGAAADEPDRRAPQHVVLTPTADPARSTTLTWRSSAPARDQRVVVTGPSGSRRVDAVSKGVVRQRFSGTDVPAFTTTVDGLEPGTTYRYRIGSGDAAARGTFRTADADLGAAWSFLSLGDTQVDNAGVPRDIVRRAVREHPDARLLLHAGDVVDDPTEGSQWDALFGALAPARSLPLLVSIGNHEQCKLMRCRDGDAQAFTDSFTFPDNGFAHQRPTWFRTDYQGVRFVVLDPFGPDLARQARFLEASLERNPMRWTVVLMHQGPFASRADRSSTNVFYDLWPIMKRHRVDLVLTGHDHSYDRGYQGDPDGPVVLTSNSGPKEYPPSDLDWKRRGATRVVWAKHVSTYQVVDVSRDRLRVRAVVGFVGERAVPRDAAVGQVLDDVTIDRGTDGRNRVTW
ncbi:MAG: metallophosphoesterase family protein [Aeromicrobium erythreum]